ncbi:MAG: hypothetical protein WCJ37_12570 [Syntrophus sp. (in: bacteria)]
MDKLKYEPVSHDHKAFLKKAQKREGFSKAHSDLKKEYTLVREMLSARSNSGLTQEAVAELMRTTKSAVSTLGICWKACSIPDNSEKICSSCWLPSENQVHT